MEQYIQHVQNNLTHLGAFLYHICVCPQNVWYFYECLNFSSGFGCPGCSKYPSTTTIGPSNGSYKAPTGMFNGWSLQGIAYLNVVNGLIIICVNILKPSLLRICFLKKQFQRLQLDRTSKADPVTLLEKISRNGISQDVCINDLGMYTWPERFLYDQRGSSKASCLIAFQLFYM